MNSYCLLNVTNVQQSKSNQSLSVRPFPYDKCWVNRKQNIPGKLDFVLW